MIKVRIHQGLDEITREIGPGKNLLQIINESGLELFSPCGGNGTCGKCRVHLGDGSVVTSCIYYPSEDLEVFLPGHRESVILSKQHDFIRSVPLMPGQAAMMASYPMGIAIDIGTTTLVFYLLNLITGSLVKTEGVLNPQGKYGADVISRIQHCTNPEGLHELQNELISSINICSEKLLASANVSTDALVKITISGNTTMLHILLGVDPTPLALAPFTPAFTEYKELKPADIGLKAATESELHILPSISAYVGADIVAGLASLHPPSSIKNYLFIDIGTNGEMALVTPKKLYCCATAAGPAFEGANISCGMGAVSGAISVYHKPGDFSTISNSTPIGVCGSGLIDILAYMLREKLIDGDGVLEEPFGISEKSENHQLFLTQEDIREVQLAKAAIMAGVSILVRSAGLEYKNIDALFLAGGFGNYINQDSAIEIGLLPLELREKIIPVGNTSGTGASLLLKSNSFMEAINEILEKAEYIELSTNDDFVLEFAMNMNFSN